MKIPCYRPFTSVLIDDYGDVYFCCMAWQVDKSLKIGNLKDSTISELWNNEKAKEVRAAMYENKTKRYCSEKTCPIRLGNTQIDVSHLTDNYYKDLFTENTVLEISAKKTSMSSFPSFIAIGLDRRCNLDCIMCTAKDIVGMPFSEIETTVNKLFIDIKKNIHDVRRLFLSANGEPLMSKDILKLLKETAKLKDNKIAIEMLSNGNLLTPDLFDQIKHNNFFSMAFSVDAATKATYEMIRRKGNWDQLMKNLSYISRLREESKIRHFEINMTVMKLNYREIYDFITMGFQLGCDQVQLHPMRGEPAEQNLLEPKVNWEAVKFIQSFLNSKEAANPKVYCAGLQVFSPANMQKFSLA